MKIINNALAVAVLVGFAAGVSNVRAEDLKPIVIKPYPLTNCIVSGQAFGGGMTAYVITNGNQQIKFCCKGCLKDFKKDPAKYLKKIEAAEKK